jgi:acyl dehydratase
MAKRPSASKPDRGVVTVSMKLLNQDGAVVLSHRDVIVMRLRKQTEVARTSATK